MLPQCFLQDLGDGLMKLCSTAVNLWKKLKLMVSHLGSLSAWLTVLGQRLMLFGQIKAPLKNFVSMWWRVPLLMIVMWFHHITEELSNRYYQVTTCLFYLCIIIFWWFFIDSLFCRIVCNILVSFSTQMEYYTEILIRITIFICWLFSLFPIREQEILN